MGRPRARSNLGRGRTGQKFRFSRKHQGPAHLWRASPRVPAYG